MVTLQSIGFGDNIQPKQESKNDFITINSMLILAQKKTHSKQKKKDHLHFDEKKAIEIQVHFFIAMCNISVIKLFR